jgi:Type IV secretion system pilin
MKNFFIALICSIFLVSFMATPSYAATPQGVPQDVRNVVGSVTTPRQIDPSSQAVNNYVYVIMNGFFFIGLIAVLLYLLYGGIKWIMSGGDPKALAAARDTLVHAVIGFLILSLSYTIATVFSSFLKGDAATTGMPPREGQGEYCEPGDPNYSCRNPIHACVNNVCECADPLQCRIGPN